MPAESFKEAKAKMDKAVEVVEHNLNTLRTGRASPTMIEGVGVEAYGTETPINQLATITTPDASTIAIQPWDQNILGAVEKGILKANIGLTPNNDGKMIRLNVPQLTEESRKDMVKRAHEIAEEGRVAIRNVRRHANDEIKKKEKSGDISEDESRKMQDRVQEVTDQHIKEIDTFLEKKEKEIMTV